METTRKQLVIAAVANTNCGIEIHHVLEILPPQKITPIPGAPRNILGLIDVRGGAVPVADFRGCLGFPITEFTPQTRFVLVNYRDTRIGLVVDAVTEVLTLEGDVFQTMHGTVSDVPAVRAVARFDDRIILEIDHERAIEAGLDGSLTSYGGFFNATPASSGDQAEGGLNIDLLEASFQLLAPRGEELVERFYARLFEAAPGARDLFPKDMKGQKKALLGSLGTIVKSLRSPQDLGTYLSGLGQRHEGYGAAAPHYELVGEVLLATMAEMAGDAWTPELQHAWTQAYGAVAQTMLAAVPAAAQKAA